MARGVTVLETRRISFQRDMLRTGLRGTIETKKQEDGTVIAKMMNQNIEAKGRDEEEAVVNLKKIVHDKFTKGDVRDLSENLR